jgi:hypothetical protein
MTVWWRGRDDTWGNAKGYNVHNQQMEKACERAGLQFASKEDADVAFQIAVPTGYEPVPGKPNVLFTMYEMDSIPEKWIPLIQKADLLIVPCRHNVAIFRKHYGGPIEVCQEGIDPERYGYIEREKPGLRPVTQHALETEDEGDRFRFLWLGATNPRKGYELVTLAWDLWCRNSPPDVINSTELYLKTQRSDSDGEKKRGVVVPPGMKHKPVRSQVWFDNRRVGDDEMMKLYADAHAFLLPSFGEGWGLTLCEAQATGAPCVYTPWSGPVDFMRPYFGYPARYKLVEQKTIVPKPDGTREIDHVGKAACADPNHIYELMVDIYQRYDRALKRGRLGSTFLHRYFTWDHAGRVLTDILHKHFGDEERIAA